MPPAPSPRASRCAASAVGGRVVEDEGRRQAQAGGRAEAVAQLDRGERVEAEVLEGSLGLDRLRRRRGRGPRRPRARTSSRTRPSRSASGSAGELGAKRARCGAAALGDAHQAAEDRRQRAGRGLRPQGGGVERNRQRRGALGARARRRRASRPCSSAERLDARAPHPRQVGLAELGDHAALSLPQAPGDRGGGQALRAGAAGRARRGRRWRRRSWPGRDRRACRRRRRRGRRRRGPRPRSARAGARRRRPWGRRPARCCSGAIASTMPSSSTPAAWTTAPSGCAAGIEASSSSSCSRSATSQAASVASAPSSSSSAVSSPAPAASAPRRLARSRWRAPCCSTR